MCFFASSEIVYSWLPISWTPDKLNLLISWTIFSVPWISLTKLSYFLRISWTPDKLNLPISWTIFSVQCNEFLRISWTLTKYLMLFFYFVIFFSIFFILFLLTLDIIRYNIDQQLILDLPHYHMYDIELKCPLAPSPYTHKHLTCTQFEKYRYIWSIFSNFG